MVQILAETFNAPAMYLSSTAPLVLHASGKSSGLAVECGEFGSVASVMEGCTLRNTAREFGGGRRVDEMFCEIISSKIGSSGFFENFATARKIKEEHSLVCIDFEKEVQVHKKEDAQTFTLPDGTVFELGDSYIKIAECLFRPNLFGMSGCGIQEEIFTSLMFCEESLRCTVGENIIICGGTTLMKGFRERLVKEISSTGSKFEVPLKMEFPESLSSKTLFFL